MRELRSGSAGTADHALSAVPSIVGADASRGSSTTGLTTSVRRRESVSPSASRTVTFRSKAPVSRGVPVIVVPEIDNPFGNPPETDAWRAPLPP